MYYYYNINRYTYKYTYLQKNTKYTLNFYCSDTSCPGTGKYKKTFSKIYSWRYTIYRI